MGILIITGMHRSGTSMLANLLQTAGVNIGERLIEGVVGDNQYGYFEDKDFEGFQEAVLKSRGCHIFDEYFKDINWTEREYSEAKRLLDKKIFHNKEHNWGWKDPRTTLFLNQWDEIVPNANYIFVYRHPVDVMLSLLKRKGIFAAKPEKALISWELYNRKMYDFVVRNKHKSLLVNIDAVISDPALFNELAKKRSLVNSPILFDEVFDKDIFHTNKLPEGLWLFLEKNKNKITSLYETLEEIADMPIGHNKYLEKCHDPNQEVPTVKILFERYESIHSELVRRIQVRDSKLNQYETSNIIKLISKSYDAKSSQKIVKGVDRIIGKAQKVYKKIYNKSLQPIDKSKINELNKLKEEQIQFVYNDNYDTKYAHSGEKYNNVLHVFHIGESWNGVRSAADYMPGNKIGFIHDASVNNYSLGKLLQLIEEKNQKHLIFHSATNFMFSLADMLKKKLGDNIELNFVWHASAAQLENHGLVQSFIRLLELRKQKVIEKIGIVKKGLNGISDLLHEEPLINFLPNVVKIEHDNSIRENSVLVPLPNHLRKNLYTNYFAVDQLPEVQKVYITQFEGLELFEGRKEYEVIGDSRKIDREKIFELLNKTKAAFTVSLSECQPMIYLEALAFKTPVLTGPLEYGVLDDHPYRQLTEVLKADSIDEIASKGKDILHKHNRYNDELCELMGDFERQLLKNAFIRLDGFLE